MKTRTFKILNIIAVNLLLLALYLNFIHKDNNAAPTIPAKEPTTQRRTSAQSSQLFMNATPAVSQQATALN